MCSIKIESLERPGYCLIAPHFVDKEAALVICRGLQRKFSDRVYEVFPFSVISNPKNRSYQLNSESEFSIWVKFPEPREENFKNLEELLSLVGEPA
jgi:hypothetical protein